MDRINKTVKEKREAALQAVEDFKVELNDLAKLQLKNFNFTEKTEVYIYPGKEVSICNPNGFTLTIYSSGVVSFGSWVF